MKLSSAVFAFSTILVASPLLAEDSARGEFYGFAMTDMGYSDGSTQKDWFDVLRPTQLPGSEADLISKDFTAEGDYFASVRQSRLGVKGWFPIGNTDQEIFTLFEFELFGVGADAGQTTFRLRHAYGEYGVFGAGQYWSGFMDIDTFPNSQEYWGPSGMPFYRNIQVRWMPIKNDTHDLLFSLEKPGGSNDPNTEGVEGAIADRNFRNSFSVPDIAAAYKYSDDWGYVRIAGIARQIGWDDNGPVDGSDDGVDQSDDLWGYGVNLTANFRFGPGDSVLRLGVASGDGIGNYMNDGAGDVSVDCTNPCTGAALSSDLIGIVGVTAFYDIWWSARWSSTVGFSTMDVDNKSTTVNPSNLKSSRYALTNLQYHPTRNVMFGAELQYAERKNESDGWEYDTWRVQLSAKYNFSFNLGG